MDTEKVYTTSLRLYKNRPVHHQAYRYLKEYNKDIFKTKDDFIAEAIVYFAKYLQQEEDVQQMKLLNTLLPTAISFSSLFFKCPIKDRKSVV